MNRFVHCLILALTSIVFGLLAMPARVLAAADDGSSQPVTVANPGIGSEELGLLLVPLNKAELLIEADGWRRIVKTKAQEIALIEISIRRENEEIDQADDVEGITEAATARLQEATELIEAAGSSADEDAIAAETDAIRAARDLIDSLDAAADAARETGQAADARSDDSIPEEMDIAAAAERARQVAAELRETLDRASAPDRDRPAQGAESDPLAEGVAALTAAELAMEAAEAAIEEEKVELLEQLTALRDERTRLLDNLRTVIDELEKKTVKGDADTRALIDDYRRYISTVAGLHVDVTDTTSAWVSLKGWAVSPEGGIRWLINLGSSLGILVLAWLVSRLSSFLAGRAFSRLRLPHLLEDFLSRSVRWVVMIFGVIWALAALEVSVGPLLALVGAAGFILAFAMQDSLSNFASGMMILIFRPFDTGHIVDAGGVSGTISSMNLVATTIKTFDNKLMVVPNSKIWSDVITNATGVNQRRVDMEFGIGYDDDLDEAQQILEDIIAEHPMTLDDPEPVIRLHQLGDSSVNFICRPWTTPAGYWEVYWDVTRAVKQRFDEAGIGIPYPQRDVHLYVEKGQNTAQRSVSDTSSGGQQLDGGLDT